MTTKSQLYINYCTISSRKVLFDHVDALAQLKEGPYFRRNLFVVVVVFFSMDMCALLQEKSSAGALSLLSSLLG